MNLPASRPAEIEALLADEHRAMSMRLDERLAAIAEGLESCTPRQRYVWRQHTGISEDGTQGDAWTMQRIAVAMGVTKESVRAHYIEADRKVLIFMVESLLRGVRAAAPSTPGKRRRTDRSRISRN